LRTAIDIVTEVLLGFVALWPIVTAAVWIAGGLLYRLIEERSLSPQPSKGWPGVTLLLPCYQEAAVIGNAVLAARRVDYPELEVLVLDDGSTDGTAEAARVAADADPRVRVVRDPVNRGKADRLNVGMHQASHDLVLAADADAHLEHDAIRRLVSRMLSRPRVAAVAGMPLVTNRGSLLAGLQMLEFPSIVGLIRRTQALGGRVGTVAGIIGLFRRDAVLAVGGYNPAMATEDIELTWRLLLAGWETDFEPHALVGMEVPVSMRGLWAQRKRWARGQGEVVRTHFAAVRRWRNRRMWPIAAEALGSAAWVLIAGLAALFVVIDAAIGDDPASVTAGLAWGIAVAVVAAIQLGFALALQAQYDWSSVFTLMLGPLYPMAYWLLNAAAVARSEVPALIRGAYADRVVWNLSREPLPAPETSTAELRNQQLPAGARPLGSDPE
jgi:biofilm PGA synthesis N-glycosyltransferase PgaC